jgi:hypothetical protein
LTLVVDPRCSCDRCTHTERRLVDDEDCPVHGREAFYRETGVRGRYRR